MGGKKQWRRKGQTKNAKLKTEKKAKTRESEEKQRQRRGTTKTNDRKTEKLKQSRVEIDAEQKPRIETWTAFGFAMEERKRLAIAEQLCTRDLHTVGFEGPRGKQRGGGMQSSWVRMDRGKNKGTYCNSKNRGVGGVRFLVKYFMCDILEVSNDTKFDKIVRMGAPGEWRAKSLVLGNSYIHTPRVEEYNERGDEEKIRRGTRWVAVVDVRKYKRRGEVVVVGGFTSRTGEAGDPNENIGYLRGISQKE